MKKFVLSVSCALLSAVLLVGCAPQPTVSTDAPPTAVTTTTTATTTTAAPTTTTTTVATTTTTTTAKPTTIITTAKPTTTKTVTTKPATTSTTTKSSTTTTTKKVTTTTHSGPVTFKKARAMALAHFGFTKKQVTFVEQKKDNDGVEDYYFFMFYNNGRRYNYKIACDSGQVLDYSTYSPLDPTTTTTIKLPREYSVKFKRDDSVGWKQLYKNDGDIPSSYIVGGTADVYINGKWVSIEKAVKNDPKTLIRIWNSSRYDNLTHGDRVKQYKVRGPDLWYVEYTDFKIGYWWGGEEPDCPVHPYPRWDLGFENLSEEEQKELDKVIEEEREYLRAHNYYKWYILFPSDTPHLTREDMLKLGICYMDI